MLLGSKVFPVKEGHATVEWEKARKNPMGID